MNNILKTCRWILKGGNENRHSLYYEEKVAYKLVKDEEGNTKRVYNTFCDKHQLEADKHWQKRPGQNSYHGRDNVSKI